MGIGKNFVALCAAAALLFPAPVSASVPIDDLALLEQAIDALQDGNDTRYTELIDIALSRTDTLPRLVIDAIVDRDTAVIVNAAEMLTLSDNDVIEWVVESIEDEQALLSQIRNGPNSGELGAEMRDTDSTNAAYLFLLRRRGIEISPAVSTVMGLLPPPNTGTGPHLVEYTTAIRDLEQLMTDTAAVNSTLNNVAAALTPDAETAKSAGTNPFLPIGIASIGFALGLFALWRGRRHLTLATTDALTGLNNRRRFDLDIDDGMSRGHRPTAMLMIDIDSFKAFNDTHGHGIGDTVLRQVGTAIGTTVRSDDVTYRYGGEEFCVLLPDTDQETAAVVAERVRKAVAAIELPVSASVSVSIGVASGPSADLTTTFGHADKALYAAKDGGRNQVAVG